MNDAMTPMTPDRALELTRSRIRQEALNADTKIERNEHFARLGDWKSVYAEAFQLLLNSQELAITCDAYELAKRTRDTLNALVADDITLDRVKVYARNIAEEFGSTVVHIEFNDDSPVVSVINNVTGETRGRIYWSWQTNCWEHISVFEESIR